MIGDMAKDIIYNIILKYKGYSAKIYFDEESKKYRGIIEGIDDYVDFEADDFSSIDLEFYLAVEDYIAFCNEVGKTIK